MRYYLACYDICDSRRLKLAHSILLDYAHSRQYSVFECRLNNRERDELLHRMDQLLEQGDGFALIPMLHEGPVFTLGTPPNGTGSCLFGN